MIFIERCNPCGVDVPVQELLLKSALDVGNISISKAVVEFLWVVLVDIKLALSLWAADQFVVMRVDHRGTGDGLWMLDL